MDGGAWWAAVHGVAKSDMTERFHFHFSLSSIGEGNGNPLQCSCLENPRDGGAWWVAVYGITQSRTRLKWLSSSSSTLCWNKLSDNIMWPVWPFHSNHVRVPFRWYFPSFQCDKLEGEWRKEGKEKFKGKRRMRQGHRWQGKTITVKMGYRLRKENGRGKAQGKMPKNQGMKRKGKKWRGRGWPRSGDHPVISLGKDHRARPAHIGQFRELRPRWGPMSHPSAHWLLLPPNPAPSFPSPPPFPQDSGVICYTHCPPALKCKSQESRDLGLCFLFLPVLFFDVSQVCRAMDATLWHDLINIYWINEDMGSTLEMDKMYL